MFISIIIPAFNEETLLENTLEKIEYALSENRDRDFSWEIIVCDNNSTDRTPEIASRMGAKVVFESVNQISRARNRGAETATGDWFLFIDADSYPSPGLIHDILNLIENGNVIGCGSTLRVEGGTLFNKLRMERLNPIFRFLNASGGAFLLCEKKAFLDIGGFSQNLFAYEEVDFVFRLKRYGRKHGKKFKVLHRNPVVTSGRKGDYNITSIGRLFLSNSAAVAIFILHHILPKSVIKKIGRRPFGYWYKNRT